MAGLGGALGRKSPAPTPGTLGVPEGHERLDDRLQGAEQVFEFGRGGGNPVGDRNGLGGVVERDEAPGPDVGQFGQAPVPHLLASVLDGLRDRVETDLDRRRFDPSGREGREKLAAASFDDLRACQECPPGVVQLAG